MKCILQLLFTTAAVILGDDNGRTGRQSYEETNDEVDDLAGRAAYAGQGFFSYKTANYHGICRVVKLLEKRSEQNRQEKDQNLLPDNTLCNLIYLYYFFLLFVHT